MTRERKINFEVVYKFSSEVREVLLAYIKSEANPTVTNRFYQILFLNSRMGAEIKALCDFFSVSRSGYYKWIKNKDERYNREIELCAAIAEIQMASDETAGYRSVCLKLNYIRKKRGLQLVSKSTVYRLMKKYALLSKSRTTKRNKIIKKSIKLASNILNRDYDRESGEFWCVDISIYKTGRGERFYICAIVDLGGRYLINYKISRRENVGLVVGTIKDALEMYPDARPRYIHSDNGGQFYSKSYRNILGLYNIKQSASKPGTPCDNAVIESFFSCLKRECLYHKEPENEREIRRAVKEYVFYYNNYRILHRYQMTPYERWIEG